MPLPVIANCIRCTVFGTVEGGVGWANTMHFSKLTGNSNGQAISDADTEVRKLYQQIGYGAGKYGWAQYNSDGTKVLGSSYTPLDGSTASTSFSWTQAGVSSQAPLPAQNAMSITLRTGLRGRSYRGRVFWTCSNREVIDTNGLIADADLAGTTSAFASFIAALEAKTSPLELVVASYLHGTASTVLSAQPHGVMAHQTHRRGRGA